MNAQNVPVIDADRGSPSGEKRPAPREPREKSEDTQKDLKKPSGWMGDAPAAHQEGMRIVSRIGFCPRR